MSQVLVSEEYLADIGDAIREKNGLDTTYLPQEMGLAIRTLPTEQGTALDKLTATENGTYDPPAGYGGFSQVEVAVPSQSYQASVESTLLPRGTATVNHVMAYAWATEAQVVN